MIEDVHGFRAVLGEATPSISSSSMRTRSRMLDSVRMWSRSCPMIVSSKRFALSRGVAQASLPVLMSDWHVVGVLVAPRLGTVSDSVSN